MKTLLAAAGMIAVLTLPLPARAQHVDVYKLRDKSVDAQFMSFDASGCIRTDVAVIVSAFRIVDTSATPSYEPMLDVTYAVNDVCNPGAPLLSGIGSTDAFTFTMDSGLQNAHASGTVPVSDDQNGTMFNMSVDLSWTGVGDVTRGRVKDFSDTPDFSIKMRAQGSFRDATATGTVSDSTTDFTPAGSNIEASMEVVSTASVTIQRD